MNCYIGINKTEEFFIRSLICLLFSVTIFKYISLHFYDHLFFQFESEFLNFPYIYNVIAQHYLSLFSLCLSYNTSVPLIFVPYLIPYLTIHLIISPPVCLFDISLCYIFLYILYMHIPLLSTLPYLYLLLTYFYEFEILFCVLFTRPLSIRSIIRTFPLTLRLFI